MVRAFLALELSGGIRDALAGAQEVLRTCRARLTFVDPSQIHITVKFLGDVDDQKIPDVKNALRAVLVPPFVARMGIVTVNSMRRPFTIWCMVDDAGGGAELQKMIDAALSPLGFAAESRPFFPHATVARIKRFDPSLLDALRSLDARTYGECRISGMKLKKSTLTPSGPVYEDLLEVVW